MKALGQGVFESGERLLDKICKKSFSEQKGALLKASIRKVFKNGRVSFEEIGKEFFSERRKLP